MLDGSIIDGSSANATYGSVFQPSAEHSFFFFVFLFLRSQAQKQKHENRKQQSDHRRLQTGFER
jgi:hypothetical protein